MTATPREVNTVGTSGQALVTLPDEYHENAFIEIDTGSPGGIMWRKRNHPFRLQFQYLAESEHEDTATASYATHDILGRSESYQAYERTETREFSLSLFFMAQGGKGMSLQESLTKEVKEKTDWLRALTYPVYENQRMYPPPVVNVGFGRMFVAKGLPLRALVKSVSVRYCANDGPVDVRTLLPYTAQADIEFSCVYNRGTGGMLDSSTVIGGFF